MYIYKICIKYRKEFVQMWVVSVYIQCTMYVVQDRIKHHAGVECGWVPHAVKAQRILEVSSFLDGGWRPPPKKTSKPNFL